MNSIPFRSSTSSTRSIVVALPGAIALHKINLLDVAHRGLRNQPCHRPIKGFYLEIGMDTPAEFRKHAADCKKMVKVSGDRETKVAWKRMAERWLLCAKLAEDQDMVQLRRKEENRSKPHRRPPHHWAA
jgi:hypothetical protein